MSFQYISLQTKQPEKQFVWLLIFFQTSLQKSFLFWQDGQNIVCSAGSRRQDQA